MDKISKYVNFIRSIPYFKDVRIEIRLHPKNMHDKNIKEAILKKFKNIKINKCDLEKNLGKSYCFFIEHSFTAYYYLWRGGVCFSLENDSFAYSNLYNDNDHEMLIDLNKFQDLDKNDYYNRRNNLLKLCIAHTIVYDGTEKIIKRVIAVSGEAVRIDANGNILVNEKKYSDAFSTKTLGSIPKTFRRLEKGEYWVVGDNRSESWYGIINIKNVEGKVLY